MTEQDIEALISSVHAEDWLTWCSEVEREHTISKGKRVLVVKGYALRRGVEGTCFWVGPDKFSPQYQHRPWRVGFATDDGTKLYTAITNVVTIDTDEPSLSEYTSTDIEARGVALATLCDTINT